MTDAVLRIGEVSRRTGVTVSALRAWERRYELLEPDRTDGGHRLYSEGDVRRVRAMQGLLEEGWAAAAAAREVRQGSGGDVTQLRAVPSDDPDTPVEELRSRLRAALDGFDTHATNLAVDDLLARLDVAAALERVVFPVLRWVGEGWREEPRAIAREHFATNLLRPRLLRMVRTTTGAGRVAVAATPAAEEHDLGLLGAAAVLSTANWSVRYLGARTPDVVLAQACAEARADVALVAAVSPANGAAFAADPPDLGTTLLVLGGAGFADLDSEPQGALVANGPLSELPDALEAALTARRAARG